MQDRLGIKKWEFISWFCHETSQVTSGKALDALAHLTHVSEMGIISSMIKNRFYEENILSVLSLQMGR